MGRRLGERLARRGHAVKGLVRAGSEGRVPRGCNPVVGNALDASTFAEAVKGCETFVQLVGVAHPSPAKGKEFEAVDRVSCEQSVITAKGAGVGHFVYVSVAHPAPMMKDYIRVRSECEQKIVASGMGATMLRPWYVLGPGHYWPYLLKPGYWLARQIPSMRESAIRLGLVTLEQMLDALENAVENPPSGTAVRIWGVPEIQRTAVSTRHSAGKALWRA